MGEPVDQHPSGSSDSGIVQVETSYTSSVAGSLRKGWKIVWGVGAEQHQETRAYSWFMKNKSVRGCFKRGQLICRMVQRWEEWHVCELLSKGSCWAHHSPSWDAGTAPWHESRVCSAWEGFGWIPVMYQMGQREGRLTTAHQVRPRGPEHRILEWEGGDLRPIKKEKC
jgi:hypothetical protein